MRRGGTLAAVACVASAACAAFSDEVPCIADVNCPGDVPACVAGTCRRERPSAEGLTPKGPAVLDTTPIEIAGVDTNSVRAVFVPTTTGLAALYLDAASGGTRLVEMTAGDDPAPHELDVPGSLLTGFASPNGATIVELVADGAYLHVWPGALTGAFVDVALPSEFSSVFVADGALYGVSGNNAIVTGAFR